mgnify:CR=1 FL=1
MVNIIENDIIERMDQIFTVIAEYDYVYISIGSKPNGRFVPFQIEHKRSNAYEQMFPVFLRTEEHRILILAIDIFDNKTLSQVSSNLNYELTHNIDFYLINQICDESFLTTFLNAIVSKLVEISFSPSSLIICNFVRFMNEPNQIEKESENMIPQKIQSSLDNTVYDRCFYQWFGYRFQFYNYVYNYKNLQDNSQTVIRSINSVESLLKNIKKKQHSTTVVQDEDVLYILKNIYNICDHNYTYTNMMVSAFHNYTLYNIIASVP